MSTRMYRILCLVPWVALPYAIAEWLTYSDRMPARMATHFDAAWRANGWSPPAPFFTAMMTALLVVLITFGLLGLLVRRVHSFAWVLLAFEYTVVGVVTVALIGTIQYNLTGSRALFRWMLPLIGAGITVAIITMAMALLRGDEGEKEPRSEVAPRQITKAVNRRDSVLIAEETHRSGVAAVLIVLALAPVLLVARHAPTAVKVLLVVTSTVIIWAAMTAWTGFVYRFTTAGLEIRASGMRLKFVPKATIREYREQECDPLSDFGGWGMKMRKGLRAYIWRGHTGVRVRTWNGDVYLGHEEPERLVRDFDQMMKFA